MDQLPNASYSPDYPFVFAFERDFDHRPRSQWFHDNWITAFYWIGAYLVIIFGGQHLMQKRKPFSLRLPLLIWNLLLAGFSIVGTLRTLPELIHTLRNFGFHHSVCHNSYHSLVPVSSCWTFLFIVSKAPELGDTVFIVLRKQKLIFLHWYHHVTVLLFTWYAYADEAATGRWYIDMNYMVHALMYSYYAVRAAGIRVPRPIAMAITSSQIVQMAIGTWVTCYALMAKRQNVSCFISDSVIWAGIAMYFSYFLLFAQFFRNAYLSRRRDLKQKTN